jgi:hypothetical protein
VIRWGAFIIAALLGASCARSPLFVTDSRLRIVAPTTLQVVTAPVRVAWTAHDLPAAAAAYVVFIDRAPIHPGQSLRSVAHGDVSCEHTPGCPDVAYLRSHDVFLTRTPSVTIPYLGKLAGVERQDKLPIHHVTIILVDRSGDRLGEYGYGVDFRLMPTST